MAVVKPFAAFRPRADIVDKVAALPYDVYNRKEAIEEIAKEPLSFLRIDRPETNFDESVDTYAPCVYNKAKELLDEMIADGSYIQEGLPVYFVYELIMDGRSQVGLVACASVSDYENEIIKKHENTRADKEIDRINHVDTCSAQTGPIFLAYRAIEEIDNIINHTIMEKKVYGFTSPDGVTHNVWIINNQEKVDTIINAFDSMNSIYIADGHHRAASAVKVSSKRRQGNIKHQGDEEYNYFLSVLFPHNQLKILPYNRVIKDLNGLDKKEFLNSLTKFFFVSESNEPVSPSNKGVFGMFLDNQWYRLTAKSEIISDDPVKGLDVSILQDNLLEPILGIKDPRVDKRIDFVGGIRGLLELEKRVDFDMEIAFSMYPTSIDELFSVADAGMLMPPKSTWFEPKLRSGIFIHKI